MSEGFLYINEYRVPIKINTPVRTPEQRGNKFDSMTGKRLRVLNKRANNFELETTLVSGKKGSMLRGLIQGYGHLYDFEDSVYSSKGLRAKKVGDDVTVGGKVLETTSSFCEFHLPLTRKWSFLFCDESDTTYYCQTSEDDIYEDGESGAELPSGVEVEPEYIRFEDMEISELIILPFLVTDDFVESRVNPDYTFSPLPRLDIDGLITGGEREVYEGEVTEVEYVPFFKDGNFYRDGQIVKFSLYEV